MKRRWVPMLFLSVLLVLVCVSIALLMRGFRREQADHELILAIKANQTNRALDALDARANPNIRDRGEAEPSFQHYLFTLWQQLCGVKPTAPRTGVTALALAVQQNNSVVVDALLARGARNVAERVPVQLGGEGDAWSQSLTLLMMATRNKNLAVVQSLLRHGWDVNERNADLETALYYAEDAATVKMLAGYGADLNVRTVFESTTLDERLKVDPEVVDTLLDLGAYDRKAMSWAIEFDQTAALKKMIHLGWKLNGLDEEGQTPLTSALFSSNRLQPDAALLLIQSGADVNQSDKFGYTPLMLAADGGRYPEMDTRSPEVIKALLAHGARIDGSEEGGVTPLMNAAFHLRPKLIQLLLRQGARVNRRTKSGETALSIARHSPFKENHHDDQSEVVRLLKAAGANE